MQLLFRFFYKNRRSTKNQSRILNTVKVIKNTPPWRQEGASSRLLLWHAPGSPKISNILKYCLIEYIAYGVHFNLASSRGRRLEKNNVRRATKHQDPQYIWTRRLTESGIAQSSSPSYKFSPNSSNRPERFCGHFYKDYIPKHLAAGVSFLQEIGPRICWRVPQPCLLFLGWHSDQGSTCLQHP